MTIPKDKELRRPGEHGGHLAHNSYLQSFADYGFVGGCLFVGTFLIALWSVYGFHTRGCVQFNLDAKQLQPYVLACVTAYALGMLSLSLCHVITTYMMLALAAAYTRVAQGTCLVAPPPVHLDFPWIGRCLAAGVCFLFCIYVFLRVVA
jgi:hypothetical protein